MVQPLLSALHAMSWNGVQSIVHLKLAAPVDWQIPLAHGPSRLLQSGAGPAVHVPAWHMSPTVQPLPSALQPAPSSGTGFFLHSNVCGPRDEQNPTLHWSLATPQSGAVPATHVPSAHVSPAVQPSLSALQDEPLRGAGFGVQS